ncbi:hypothetical protein [Brevibacterium litoralis]|uniref:hypothetical protein n=1 Tax=Brevibacterium litoralis TaxID=3138935 RepID=UPI0032ED957C
MTNNETHPDTTPTTGLGRRGVLAGAGAATVAGLLGATMAATPAGASAKKAKPNTAMPVQFGADGKLRIVQFNDTQDTHLTDKRTIELIEKTLDTEEPGFVVLNGDVINGVPSTATQVKQAYNNVLAPTPRSSTATPTGSCCSIPRRRTTRPSVSGCSTPTVTPTAPSVARAVTGS